MSQPDESTPFDDCCQQYLMWIIRYQSPRYPASVFLIWYTDTDPDHTDRLLTYPSGDIIAIDSLPDMIRILEKDYPSLTPAERLPQWLASVRDMEPVVDVHYDLSSLLTAISDQNYSVPTLDGLTNWINLFGDFVYQDERNSHLEVYHQDETLRKAWDYYYDTIFWPKMSDKIKFKLSNRPPLDVDPHLLAERLLASMEAFEARIHLVKADPGDVQPN
jgi:hypothetical protein